MHASLQGCNAGPRGPARLLCRRHNGSRPHLAARRVDMGIRPAMYDPSRRGTRSVKMRAADSKSVGGASDGRCQIVVP